MRKLYLSNKKSFSKLILFDSNKREATLCFEKPNRVFKNHLIWNHSKERGVFCFGKQRLSKDLVFKTCIDFNPFQKAPFISKDRSTLDFKSFANRSLIIQTEFQNYLSWKVLETSRYLQNVLIKMVSNSTRSLFQNIFCPKSLFGKVYKMVWILRLPF